MCLEQKEAVVTTADATSRPEDAGNAGRIVNVSSILGRFAPAGSGIYAASKFALEAASEALRVELAPIGVRVVLVQPGVVDTALYQHAAALSGDQPPLGPYQATWPAGFGVPARLLQTATPVGGIAAWTLVRSNFMFQNFSESFWLEPVLAGELAFPAGDVAEPSIDAAGIAEVAVAALTDDRHVGQLYEVTGPRLLTFAEAVAEIAKATGRTIRYVPISMDQYTLALGQDGLPAAPVSGLTGLLSEVLDGRNAQLADGVQRALGRQPRDFSDYARETAASGVWDR